MKVPNWHAPLNCVQTWGWHQPVDRKPELVGIRIESWINDSINGLIQLELWVSYLKEPIEGIPSIGFSLDNYDRNADLEPAKFYMKIISEKVLKNGLPKGIALNVNIPYLPLKDIKGIKIARQALDRWNETYDKRTNPFGRDYYWLNGNFTYEDKGKDTPPYMP